MNICLVIYKIDADKGSENATGYHLAKRIVKQYSNTTIISRTKNTLKLQIDPDFKNTILIGVDVPRSLSFYKKKSRGIILYYYIWQICVGRLVKKLQKQQKFDVIHQINFHTDWAPHFLKHDKIVWGPLVHHPSIPFSWFPTSCKHLALYDIAKTFIKKILWSYNPHLKQAVKQSDHIIFGNNNIPKTYRQHANDLIISPYAGSHWPVPASIKNTTDSFHLLFIGRLITLKGPHLAIDAYGLFLDWLKHEYYPAIKPHLTIIGSGELESLLSKKIKMIEERHGAVVTLSPWMERELLPALYQSADYLLYPSLESQGLVVAEAMSQYCPVITLADAGPAFVTQNPDLTITCNQADYKACVQAMAEKLRFLYTLHVDQSPFIQDLRLATAQRARDLSWDTIANKIIRLYS